MMHGTTNIKLTTEAVLPHSEFEPAIPASQRPQTHALDHAATGIR